MDAEYKVRNDSGYADVLGRDQQDCFENRPRSVPGMSAEQSQVVYLNLERSIIWR